MWSCKNYAYKLSLKFRCTNNLNPGLHGNQDKQIWLYMSLFRQEKCRMIKFVSIQCFEPFYPVFPHFESLILRSQFIYRMSKLEKYLKTPKLKQNHFLSFQEDQVDLHGQQINMSFQPNTQMFPENIRGQNQRVNASLEDGPYSYDYGHQMEQEQPLESGKKVISKKLNFQDESYEQIIGTPEKKDKELQLRPTTACKKYELRLSQSARFCKYDLKDHEMTLKNLAKLAYDAVIEKGPTNYREVAEYIIRDKVELGENMDSKERNNIKRRVYDALNVLIALGKLDKKGRNIQKDPKKLEAQAQKQAEKVLLQAQIKYKTQKLAEERKVIRRKKRGAEALKAIIQRNINFENQNFMEPNNILRFPTLSCPTSSLANLHMNSQEVKIKFANKSNCEIFGDLQLLAFMPPLIGTMKTK